MQTTYTIISTDPFTVEYLSGTRTKKVIYQTHLLPKEIEVEARYIVFDAEPAPVDETPKEKEDRMFKEMFQGMPLEQVKQTIIAALDSATTWDKFGHFAFNAFRIAGLNKGYSPAGHPPDA